MTPTELALDEIAAGLNALALAVLALVIALILLSWSVDDIGVRVRMFGVIVRRLAPLPKADAAAASEPSATVPVSETPAAQKAAKAVPGENHAQ